MNKKPRLALQKSRFQMLKANTKKHAKHQKQDAPCRKHISAPVVAVSFVQPPFCCCVPWLWFATLSVQVSVEKAGARARVSETERAKEGHRE